jgi:hypothetical protein
MTKDDVIRMAREAGFRFSDEEGPLMANHAEWQRQLFERFAALVAAAEREACAALLENADLGGLAEYPGWQRYTADLLTKVAAAIRARGQA